MEPLTVSHFGGGTLPLRKSDTILGLLPAQPQCYEMQGTVWFDKKFGWTYDRIGYEISGAYYPPWDRVLRRQRKIRRRDTSES